MLSRKDFGQRLLVAAWLLGCSGWILLWRNISYPWSNPDELWFLARACNLLNGAVGIPLVVIGSLHALGRFKVTPQLFALVFSFITAPAIGFESLSRASVIFGVRAGDSNEGPFSLSAFLASSCAYGLIGILAYWWSSRHRDVWYSDAQTKL